MIKLLSKKDVAEMLGLSIYTIDRFVMEKRNLPFIKLGSRVLFDEDDILAFIESQKELPISQNKKNTSTDISRRLS